jgi:hypothetical protein
MKYMCLVYVDESRTAGWSEKDHRAFDRRNIERDNELIASGHLLGANPLKPPSTATTVRVANRKVSVTDGPFMETKEFLGGYMLIEARDLNEAIQIAAKSPITEIAAIEIRPIMEMRPSQT